jgi:hypothetical protein
MIGDWRVEMKNLRQYIDQKKLVLVYTSLMAKDKIYKSGTIIRDCKTFEDVARAYGSVGVALPGRMLSRPKEQVQTQEEDPSQPDQKLPESP